MANIGHNPNLVKVMIEAKESMDLTAKMLEIQAINGQQFDFSDFGKANGKWFCWFMVNTENFVMPEESE